MIRQHALPFFKPLFFSLVFGLAAVGPAWSKETKQTLAVAVGWHKPPYVIGEVDSGFELELVKHLFKNSPYSVEFISVPFGRTPYMLNEQKADIGLTLNEFHDVDPSWLTEPYVVYQNAVMSLESRQYELTSLSDLRAYSVVAFQSAETVLGPEYAAIVKGREDYIELPDQHSQVILFLRGSVQLAVMDINIFHFLQRNLPGSFATIPVDMHHLFPKNPYSAGIPDATVREFFNQQLAIAIEDGNYQRLLDEFGIVDLLNN